MSETYSPSGWVGTVLNRFTSAEAATGTFGTMDRGNITTIADKIRYLDDATGLFNFPSTQVASGGANVLDDYEEGIWTPTDGSGAALTLATANATYEKIGRTVIARAEVVYPATASGSSAVIGGMPFNVPNANEPRQGFVSYTTESTLARSTPANNANTVALFNSAGAPITNVTMSGDTLFFTAIYRV